MMEYSCDEKKTSTIFARILDHLSSVAALLLDPQSRCKGLTNNPEQLCSAIQLITKVTAKSIDCRLLQGGAHGAVDPIRLALVLVY